MTELFPQFSAARSCFFSPPNDQESTEDAAHPEIDPPEDQGIPEENVDASEELAVEGDTTAAEDPEAQVEADIPPEVLENAQSKDEFVGISVSDNGMEAYATIRVNGAISDSSILNALRANGVIVGIKEDAVAELASEEGPRGFPHLVAEGEKAGDGQNAIIDLFFERSPQPKITYDEQGHADYKEVGIIQQVKEGALLAQKTPAERGKSGLTVLGKELQGRSGRDVQLIAGPGTILKANGLELVAARSGVVSWRSGNEISVSEEYVIDGDVDFNTGNVRFDGAVRIQGNVIGGFSVIASGDVEISGVVEDAYIHCGGNLHIRGGFLGRGKGVAEVAGETHIRFLENQTVICNGDVHIAEEIIFGKVTCGGQVVVRYGKGTIIGGVVSAVKGISVKTAGNIHNQKTSLIAGRVDHTARQLIRATNAMNFKQQTKDQIQKALDKLVEKKFNKKRQMTPEEIDSLDLLYRHMAGIDKWAAEITTIRNQLDEQISAMQSQATVTVDHRIHTGVKITIGSATRLIDEEMARTQFRFADGMVIASSGVV